MKWTETFTEEKGSRLTCDPLPHHFHQDSFPGSSGTMCKHWKKPCSGWEVAMFCEAAKREQQGDTLTCKQNSSATVGKSQSGLTGLQSFRVRTALSLYCWWWQSGLPSLATTNDSHPDCLLSLLLGTIWTLDSLEISQLSEVRTFSMLAHGARGPGEWILVEMVGQGVTCQPWAFFFCKSFSPFHPLLPPEKVKFLFCLA